MIKFKLLSSLLLFSTLVSCSSDNLLESIDESIDKSFSSYSVTIEDYPDWTEATHSNDVSANFDEVFNQDSVMRLDIKISNDDWVSMQSNLESIFGPSDNNNGHPGGGDFRSTNFSNSGYTQNASYENPEWDSCSIYYNGIEWYNVGIRYKGNSSLQRAYTDGSSKLSFKLDFDQFEDEYPLLKNQRFYGFKQLNLNNNFEDKSFMREKVASDLFRGFGIASAHTRFCVIYLDHGDGAEFYGVYTLVEEVDDTVIKDQFDDDDGNLYKPDGDAASFALGTYDEDELVKKTNEDEADYSDVASLYSTLNDDVRLEDSISWQSDLENVFNVPLFLRWLAVNEVIQNWDTYGNMTHNSFLYNDPSTNLLNWIPWDNNEAFNDDGRSIELSLSSVTSAWPLINYLMQQENYKSEYKANLQSFIQNNYSSSNMETLYDKYYALLKDYADDEGNSSFSTAVSTLRSHVSSRTTAVEEYVGVDDLTIIRNVFN